MKLFNKLANILFDEEVEEEIPTITKEEESIEEERVVVPPKKDDEIIVTKVEPKHEEVKETTKEMPKVEEPITKKFTFPFIDDDEDEIIPKRSEGKTIEDYSYAQRTEEIPVIRRHEEKSFDERKREKSDAYTANRNNIYDHSHDDHRPFTLSPIISPVYGILNENYTKDDIVERNSQSKEEKIDFDSVRRKAYGTLEDEIEVGLSKNTEIYEDEEDEMTVDNLKDDGISISDLLVDDEQEESLDNTETTEEEVFNVEDKETQGDYTDTEEIILDEIDEEEIEEEPKKKVNNKKENKDSEDDLFDLIDSIYAGKEENDD